MGNWWGWTGVVVSGSISVISLLVHWWWYQKNKEFKWVFNSLEYSQKSEWYSKQICLLVIDNKIKIKKPDCFFWHDIVFTLLFDVKNEFFKSENDEDFLKNYQWRLRYFGLLEERIKNIHNKLHDIGFEGEKWSVKGKKDGFFKKQCKYIEKNIEYF